MGEKAPQKPTLNADDVYHYLLDNPQFLENYPELYAVMTPPKREFNGNVEDFQTHAIDKLQGEVITMHMLHGSLFDTAKDNLDTQSDILKAAIHIQKATTLQDFVNVLMRRLPNLLQVDVIRMVAIEEESPQQILDMPDVQVISKSQALNMGIMADHIMLRPHANMQKQLYGIMAGQVASDALAQLTFEWGRVVVAFGANMAETFHDDQDTLLLDYLVHTMQICLSRLI